MNAKRLRRLEGPPDSEKYEVLSNKVISGISRDGVGRSTDVPLSGREIQRRVKGEAPPESTHYHLQPRGNGNEALTAYNVVYVRKR